MPDTSEAKIMVQRYLSYRVSGSEEDFDAWMTFNQLVMDHPRDAWPVVVLAVESATDDLALAYVAAGVLETFIARHAPEMLEEVVGSLGGSAKLRKAMRYVWTKADEWPIEARIKIRNALDPR